MLHYFVSRKIHLDLKVPVLALLAVSIATIDNYIELVIHLCV